MDTNKTDKPWDVAQATRDVVVGSVEHARALKEKAVQVAAFVEKKYEASKPAQEKAKGTVKNAIGKAATFSKEVGKGFKQGISEVQKA
jgi:hypothetical protein